MLGAVPWKDTIKDGAFSMIDERDAKSPDCINGISGTQHKSNMSLNTL